MTAAGAQRRIALDVITAVLEDGAFTNLALAEALRENEDLDKQERSFITRLVSGVIERKLTLDFVIDTYAKTPAARMKPPVRESIRMGAYQILYMDSVPDAAACNESVKLISRSYPGLKGFVNGVLRTIARRREEALHSIAEASLSVRYSMPQWIIDRWTAEYGPDRTESILAAFLTPPKTCIRTNLTRITPEDLRGRLESEGIRVEPVTGLDYAFYISGYDHITAVREYQEGLFYVQDASSMLVTQRADIRAEDHILDVCAAPGGKTLHMAQTLADIERMSGLLNPMDIMAESVRGEDPGLQEDAEAVHLQAGSPQPGFGSLSAGGSCGFVEARDRTEAKCRLIRENILRSGLGNISVRVQDAAVDDPPSHDAFDIVVADLPCSGLGVIARKPDIRYRVTPDEVISLAALQTEILHTVCRYVRPHGTLLYSTCTISKPENEDNVRAFLRDNPGFSLVSREQILPRGGANDGFFICVMRRDA